MSGMTMGWRWVGRLASVACGVIIVGAAWAAAQGEKFGPLAPNEALTTATATASPFMTAAQQKYLVAVKPSVEVPPLTFPDPWPPQMPRIEEGRAVVERLGVAYTDGAGPMVAARAGDWRLSNEWVSFTFASVDDELSTMSMPIGGYRDDIREKARVPGALIDVASSGRPLDILTCFTQGVGLAKNDLVMQYDTAEPVRRPGAVGLRLEGSPFETAQVRLETVYWIAPGEHRLRIETRLLGLPEDEPMRQICDVAEWGPTKLLVQGYPSLYREPKPLDRLVELTMAHTGDLTLGLRQERRVLGRFTGIPASSRISCLPVAADATTATAAAELTTRTLVARELWLHPGNFADLSKRLLNDSKQPAGVLRGRLLEEGKEDKPVPDGDVQVMAMDVDYLTTNGITVPFLKSQPQVYTVGKSDARGNYEFRLPPGHYGLVPLSETRILQGGAEFMEVKADGITTGTLPSPRLTRLTVRVVEEGTSRPLPARLRFESLLGTRPVDFGAPISARQYASFAYLPPAGNTFDLPAGRYAIHAIHGPSYSLGLAEIEVVNAAKSELTIAVAPEMPMDGWTQVLLGMRTRGTPGVVLSNDEAALMCAAEGLQWVVTGDFERLTDLGPAIARLRLGDRVGTSRGFRTLLPAHPEWGQFLVYPVAKDAPDPAQVRAQWAELKDSKSFFETLRRLYPGAFIQCEVPYTETGAGLFGMPGRNNAQISYEPNPALTFEFDALNLLPGNQAVITKDRLEFWYNHLISKRNFMGLTSYSGRCPLGGEPGYPRVLVRTGAIERGSLGEAELFKLLREGRYQVSNGPFIEFTLGDFGPGDLAPLDTTLSTRVRISAPRWLNIASYSYDKEGSSQSARMIFEDRPQVRRIPKSDSDAEYQEEPFERLRPLPFKDTLLALNCRGDERIPQTVLPLTSGGRPILPFAYTAPMVIDANGNGQYDGLPFSEKIR